jgi:hypothetical protein
LYSLFWITPIDVHHDRGIHDSRHLEPLFTDFASMTIHDESWGTGHQPTYQVNDNPPDRAGSAQLVATLSCGSTLLVTGAVALGLAGMTPVGIGRQHRNLLDEGSGIPHWPGLDHAIAAPDLAATHCRAVAVHTGVRFVMDDIERVKAATGEPDTRDTKWLGTGECADPLKQHVATRLLA